MRHADKNLKTGLLLPRGQARARFVASLVESGKWPQFTHVFATDSRRPEHMMREKLTAEPLAHLLNVTVDESYGKNEEVRLARGAKDAAITCGPVLIVWEHCRIPGLALMLGCADPACLACWSDANFGEVLRINVASGEHSVLAQGFDGDDPQAEVANPSYPHYECTNPDATAGCGTADGAWHCPCLFAQRGTWSGYNIFAERNSALAPHAAGAETRARETGGVSMRELPPAGSMATMAMMPAETRREDGLTGLLPLSSVAVAALLLGAAWLRKRWEANYDASMNVEVDDDDALIGNAGTASRARYQLHDAVALSGRRK